MVPKTADGRVLFAVPWLDRVVVGTTDTPRPRAETEPRALAAERDFILEHARKYLALDPTPGDVLSVFAGLRPLVDTGAAEGTAKLSREHAILVARSGLVTITGGKWTTYRRMAEDVVDQAEQVAGLPRRPCSTAELPILPPEADATDSDKIHPALPITRADIACFAHREMARTVEDVLARRTRHLLLDARASISAAPAVAEALTAELGRDDAWAAGQIRAYSELARGYVFADPASTGA
jgi:glycerol-3-phosphate dehydrogenase